MTQALRFLAALCLLIWMGTTIGISFYVAPSLFANESGRVENSTVAADIIGPLLHKMDLTAWVSIPLAMLFVFAAWKRSGSLRKGSLLLTQGLLLAALVGSVVSGAMLAPGMRQIRADLKEAYGGYHLAPKEDPERRRFASLHGQSMILTLGGLVLGCVAFYTTTQVIAMPGSSGREEASSENG